VEDAMIAAGIAPAPMTIRPRFEATVDRVLGEATLHRPVFTAHHLGGKAGRHTEYLGPMLAEMQVLHHAHPGAVW
jgi:ring-1,2-phenylacetyl-CoA epoxidase subunit PaaC